MKEEPVIVIVGASGLVGNEVIEVINARGVQASEVRLLADPDSAGEVHQVCGEPVLVDVINETSFNDADIIFFCVRENIFEQYRDLALASEGFVIDLSNRWHKERDSKILVPALNGDTLKKDDKLLSSPAPGAVQLGLVLKGIHDAASLKRVVVSTYQSTSGAGKYAMDELWDQNRAFFAQEEVVVESFPHQIAYNCIPGIDIFTEDGSTREEGKIINETRELIGLPDLKLSVTAVRVPVFHCDAYSLNVETEKKMTPEDLSQVFEKVQEVDVCSSYSDYPMHITVSGEYETVIGRVREDSSVDCGLNMWVVADNLRNSVALNAVKTAELLIERYA